VVPLPHHRPAQRGHHAFELSKGIPYAGPGSGHHHVLLLVRINGMGPSRGDRHGKEEAAAVPETDTPSQKNTTGAAPDTGVDKLVKGVDKAGEKVGEQIDRFTQKASWRVGGWINMKVFAGVTWLKLIICLLLLFCVLAVERIVRLAIKREMGKLADGKKIRYLMLEAIARPLSLFIWIYGIYFVLAPLFAHFQRPDGSNLVHTVAQKGADLGAAVALVWFIFKLVSILDYHLRNWAASTESAIDDVFAPLAGKTLRVFIVIIGALLIIQNLTGVKIGPLLASLGIGGIAVALAAKDSIANFFGTLTILFDKPFQIGDRVLIDNYDGVVENVGFRSTRIRTLTGNLVTIPNE